MRKFLFLLLPLFFFVIAYCVPLGSRGLLEPDEIRYAEISREMLESGNFILPKLVGVRYFEKPPMGYWLMATSMKYFGESPLAARLPSVIATGLTALLVFYLTWQGCLRGWYRRKKKEERGKAADSGDLSPITTASLASLIYLSSGGVFGIGTTAVLDSIFTFFLTAMIASLFLTTEISQGTFLWRTRSCFLLVLTGVFCAGAFLTKGFLALVLPVLVLGGWLLWQRRFFVIFALIWLPLVIALFLVFPWVLQIHWWDHDFWNYFFWQEHIQRFFNPADNQHKEPLWFFFMQAPILLLPWIVFVPAAITGYFSCEKEDRWDRGRVVERLFHFSILWIILPFLFFSASSGKLLTYVLPCIPPFSIMLAIGLSYFFAECKERRLQGIFHAGSFFLLLVAFAGLFLFIYVQIFGMEGLQHFTGEPGGTPLYQDAQQVGRMAAALGAMLLLLGVVWYGKGIVKAFAVGLVSILFFAFSGDTIPAQIVVKKIPRAFLEKYNKIIREDDILFVDASSLRAVSWYWHRTDLYALGWAGELDYGMKREDAKIDGRNRITSLAEFRQIAHDYPNRVVVVARTKHVNMWQLQRQLPEPLFRVENGNEGYAILRF